MSKTIGIFNFLRTCPILKNLWSIASTEEVGRKVVLPNGASPAYAFQDIEDVTGVISCEKIPYATVYEDFQINMFYGFEPNDEREPSYNLNLLNFEEVQEVCKWLEAQDDIENFPDIGEKVVSIDVEPFQPQIRYVNAEEGVIAYYITVRIRYINPRKRKLVEYERFT